MSTSLYLDPDTWDLCLDAATGDLALCSGGYALAQDIACRLRTFAGEVFYDSTQGLPYRSKLLGRMASLALLKALMEGEALKDSRVKSATVYISGVDGGAVIGQVQVTAKDGTTSSANL